MPMWLRQEVQEMLPAVKDRLRMPLVTVQFVDFVIGGRYDHGVVHEEEAGGASVKIGVLFASIR